MSKAEKDGMLRERLAHPVNTDDTPKINTVICRALDENNLMYNYSKTDCCHQMSFEFFASFLGRI